MDGERGVSEEQEREKREKWKDRRTVRVRRRDRTQSIPLKHLGSLVCLRIYFPAVQLRPSVLGPLSVSGQSREDRSVKYKCDSVRDISE